LYRFKKIDHDVRRYLPALVERLKSDGEIVAFYLFGSYAADRQTPASDIDLAVLLDRDLPPHRHFEKKLQLLSIITSELMTDEIDLVVLNQAPPALAYRVVREGKLLFEKEDGKAQRVSFQTRVWDRYFDFQSVEKILHEGLRRRIKEGRFGGGRANGGETAS
jgi:predicted nucleotidyltransferase